MLNIVATRFLAGVLLLGCFLFGVSPTSAQGVEGTAAQALFEEGRRLFEAGSYDSACEKFVESQRLEPALGTLLNLALCNEKRGKRASAWLNYSDALTVATREGNRARVAFAQERIDALAPALSRLLVKVPAHAPADQWVTLDGVALGRSAWGVALPVDGPDLVVRAGAAGRRPFEQRVRVAPGRTATLEIPALAPASPAPSEPVASERGLRRSLGAASAGVGGMALLAAGYTFFFETRRLVDERDRHCRPRCDGQAVQAARDAKRLSVLSTVGLGIGLGSAAVATYLLVTAPRASKRRAQVGVSLARGAGNVFVEGRF